METENEQMDVKKALMSIAGVWHKYFLSHQELGWSLNDPWKKLIQKSAFVLAMVKSTRTTRMTNFGQRHDHVNLNDFATKKYFSRTTNPNTSSNSSNHKKNLPSDNDNELNEERKQQQFQEKLHRAASLR